MVIYCFVEENGGFYENTRFAYVEFWLLWKVAKLKLLGNIAGVLQYSAIRSTRNIYKKPRVLKCQVGLEIPEHEKNLKKPRVP